MEMGSLVLTKKNEPSIIIYGHSWGGSQAVTLSQELERLDVPVSLTILVDSVHKPGHEDALIPPNVRNAVNFYQREVSSMVDRAFALLIRNAQT